MMKRWLFILLFFPLWAQAVCLFTPPVDWEVADPSCLAPRVKIGFIGKAQKNFRPSLNLAIEERVTLDMEGYLKCIKALHEKKSGARWRDLGTFATEAGSARLTSLDTRCQGGEIRLLQLILLKDQVAYILTATAAKEDFPVYQKEFEAAFHSLRFTDKIEVTP